MERPSRVFSSRHHISIPPLLSSWLISFIISIDYEITSYVIYVCNNLLISGMDDNHRRPRESSIIGSLTSSQRMLGTGGKVILILTIEIVNLDEPPCRSRDSSLFETLNNGSIRTSGSS